MGVHRNKDEEQIKDKKTYNKYFMSGYTKMIIKKKVNRKNKLCQRSFSHENFSENRFNGCTQERLKKPKFKKKPVRKTVFTLNSSVDYING